MLDILISTRVQAFALRTSDSFYIHYHKNGVYKESMYSQLQIPTTTPTNNLLLIVSFLPDYPDLEKELSKHRSKDGRTSFGCPRYLSLGVNGHYFIRSSSNNSYNLPKDLMEVWGGQTDKIKAVWLGMNDAWVMQLNNGAVRKNLRNQYSSNENLLEVKLNTGFGTKRAGRRIKV
jgi:hypothetical protein